MPESKRHRFVEKGSSRGHDGRADRHPITAMPTEPGPVLSCGLCHALGMNSSDGKPSRRGAVIGLLFFVIGIPIAVSLLILSL